MKPKTESDTALPIVIGVDIGKEVFHLVGFGVDGKIVFRRKIKRLGFAAVFEKVPPCIIGTEACLSAHFISRTLRTLGHEPRITPAISVQPFVKGQKNDYNDAEAIAEAALRPNLRFVQEKSQDQLDLQACHPESGAPNGRSAVCPLIRSKVRAYSHQGHGPRADQPAGYISATSDSTPSLAKGSRSYIRGKLRRPAAKTERPESDRSTDL